MVKPLIVVNFKTYENATGAKAVKLAKICEKVANDTKTKIIVCVQACDLYRVSQAVKIPVYGQHLDAVGYGSNTGFILPEAMKSTGAKGTLLNHSEHQIKFEDAKAAHIRAREMKFKTIICAANTQKGVKLTELKPDFIAVEPPELIGGDISVSTAKPELIKKSVEKIPVPVLVGAGVKTGEDVRIAMELGAKGVLLASGVTKAKNPEKVLRDLISMN